MEQKQTQELISALADGQLRDAAFARGVELAATDRSARDAWATYHLIGDVLRSGELAVASDPSAFLGRLQSRLAQERPVSMPAVQPVGQEATLRPVRAEAANEGSFRWKLVAGFASVAAVGAIAWSVVGGLPATPAGAQLATKSPAAPATVLTASDRGVMIRDARLDELLAAHRQLGGAVLPMSAGFVRNATFDSSDR